MPYTRTFSATMGEVDCTSIDELSPGDLFAKALGEAPVEEK